MRKPCHSKPPENKSPEIGKTDHEPPEPSNGNSSGSKPQAKAKTGKPRATAARAARKEPREDGEAKKTTAQTEAEPTTARVRAESRAGKGTASEPPANHETHGFLIKN